MEPSRRLTARQIFLVGGEASLVPCENTFTGQSPAHVTVKYVGGGVTST
jgi:hypothetical protein